MSKVDLLIKATEDYLKNAKVMGMEEFNLVRNLNNIILDEKIPYYDIDFTKKIPIEKSILLASDFLYNLNPSYNDHFYKRLDEDTIEFKENYTDFALSDEVDGKRYIYIPYQNNIEDAHKIVHEIMHDLNMPQNNEFNITRYMCTEALSYLIDFLFHDYTKKRKMKDSDLPIKSLLLDLKEIALETDFNLNIIEKSIDKGYVEKNIIYDVLDMYNEEQADSIKNVISNICELNFLTLDQVQQYVISIFLATHMYDRIQNNSKNINELFELNDMIQICDFDEILNYLNLTYTNDDLTQESYNNLKKSYKKYLKRI